jgi:hypothetical protein
MIREAIFVFLIIGLVQYVINMLWWFLEIPFFICACVLNWACSALWCLVASIFWLVQSVVASVLAIFHYCLWLSESLLLLLPGVGDLFNFAYRTGTFSVFEMWAQFAQNHAFAVFVLALIGLYRQNLSECLVVFVLIYGATFVYITVSTLLPMILLAAAFGLIAKGICYFCPLARPKYTGPLMCCAVTRLLQSHAADYSEVSFHFACLFSWNSLTQFQHSWLMPLTSTLSLLWIAGAVCCSSRTRRIMRRIQNRIAQAPRHPSVPRAGQPHIPRLPHFPPRERSSSVSRVNPVPEAQPKSATLDFHLEIRDNGDVYTPNGRKVLGLSENLECPICFESMQRSSTGERSAVKVLPCSHAFHSDCIAKWCRVDAQCPTCREASSPNNLRSLRDFFFK